MSPPETLVSLSRTLGDAAAGLAILAEGNTSTTEGAGDGCFWVKASGRHLGTIGPDGFVRVRSAPILDALKAARMDDAEVKGLLEAARADPAESQRPSVETFMHADLLTLPGVRWVGHTHPTHLLSILCRANAAEYAKRRLFPDEVVCCGPESVFVPYCDPGIPLAQAIRASVDGYLDRYQETPKTIWLAGHGLIALGVTPAEVVSATLMSEKAARVALGAPTALGMSTENIARIAGRADEHYRQALLRARELGA